MNQLLSGQLMHSRAFRSLCAYFLLPFMLPPDAPAGEESEAGTHTHTDTNRGAGMAATTLEDKEERVSGYTPHIFRETNNNY